MLHTIPKEKIGNLSLEMIIYYMFTEYPEIVYGYNGDMITLLRETDTIEPIDDLKTKLIKVNEDIILNGHDDEENLFIESIINIYKNFEKTKKSIDSLEILSKKIKSLKQEEFDSRNLDKDEAGSLVGNIVTI